MEISIREVAPMFPVYEDVWQLRNEVLRKPLGLELTREEVLQETKQIHLAAFASRELLGCVLLVPLQGEIKLRQMAVSEKARGRGIGKELLVAAETLAKKLGYSMIFCHARESAVDFYKSNGWIVEGSRFIEVTIPHFSMKKTL